jgi:hypothetical protein
MRDIRPDRAPFSNIVDSPKASMMADQHRDTDKPPETERPTAVNGYESASRRQNDDHGFSGRPAFG